MKDALGHGSDSHGGGIAHQSGVYKIGKGDWKGLTKLGRETLKGVGKPGHPGRAMMPSWAMSGAWNSFSS